MLYGLIGIFLVIIIILAFLLNKKVKLDTEKIKDYNDLLISYSQLKITNENLINEIKIHTSQLESYKNQINAAKDEYRHELLNKENELNDYYMRQKASQDAKLEELFQEKERALKAKEEETIRQHQLTLDEFKQSVENAIEEETAKRFEIQNQVEYERKRYEALIAPLEQYEKDKQEKLFYTIQVPDEYKPDINFLLTTVAQKVQHPDIINKLVWAEYVKPYLTATFNRVGIEHQAGIYKITNLNNGKCYIGKSTDVRKRIADHFKSSCGLKAISDQEVHHEIWSEGFWNWTIEVVIYCDKDRLNELEKFYICVFNSNHYGYNKSGGGEG